MRVFSALTALTLLTSAAAPASATGAPVPATAVAGLRLGTAGDGALEIRNGDALLVRVALKTPALRRGAPLLREVTVEGHRVAELRIPVRGTSAEEVWIGEVDGAARRVVWSGLTGPRDADGETSLWVEATPTRVTEYQTAAGVDRCDGVPPRLFPRGYDFAAGRFRPIVSLLPPAGTATLVAHRGDPAMPAGRPIADFHFVGASTTRGAGSDARGLTPPVELEDGNPATSWAEGLGGDGRGEFLTARAAAGGYAIRGLRIFPGDGASLQALRGKNRLKRFQIALGPAPAQRFDVEIPDDPAADAAHWRDPYWVSLPKPTVASCVTVVITDVTPGTEAAPPKNYGTTAIGELAIFTEADGPEGAKRLVADLATSPDCDARLPLVVGLGEAAVVPTAEALKTAARGAGRECLVEALAALQPTPKNPLVVEALAAAVTGASEKEEKLIATALGRAAVPPVSVLAELLASPSAPVDDRARAARILATLDDDAAATALLTSVGSGPAALRGAIVQAVDGARRVPADAVLAAFAAAPQRGDGATARASDLARILPTAVKRAPERRAEAISALRAALAADRSFELRGRAIGALGQLGQLGSSGSPAAVASPAAVSDDPVLRFLATRELGDLKGASGGADPRPLLRAALDDQDPRVRETAALGLEKQRDTSAGGALITGAKQEPWPFVRRAELQALGGLCVAGGGDLMIRATERDVDEVRRAALIGLSRCKDPRARTILLRTVKRRDDNASLRALAAGLIGEAGDTGAAPELAAALHDVVAESEADLALEGVAMAVLRALARLGGPDAVKAAVALAGDTRHPFRASAADALGALCDPGAGSAALRALAAAGDPALAHAAERAQKRCAK